jgi:uncharacterized RDD family membrane protein YckC
MDILTDFTPQPELGRVRYRLLALFFDDLIMAVLGFAITRLFGEQIYTETSDGFKAEMHLSGFPALVSLVLWFLLFPFMEGRTGQTLGKKLMGLKVVTTDYTEGSVGRSLVRHIFYLVDSILFIGLIVAAVGKKKQRIGDLVAGTLVVKSDSV